MMFAAVEVKEGESLHQAVHYLMNVANENECKFMSLELLGVLWLGRLRFARFRFQSKLLTDLLKTLDRGVILPNAKEYRLTFPGQEPKPVSIVTMQVAGDVGIKRVYRGPGVMFWRRQFL